MDLDRRDFFGVIAAPLLRRFAPPVPVARTTVASGSPFANQVNATPLSVKVLMNAIETLRRSTDGPIALRPTHMQISQPGARYLDSL